MRSLQFTLIISYLLLAHLFCGYWFQTNTGYRKFLLRIPGRTTLVDEASNYPPTWSMDVSVTNFTSYTIIRLMCTTCYLWCGFIEPHRFPLPDLVCHWQVISNIYSNQAQFEHPFITYKDLRDHFIAGDHLEVRWKFIRPVLLSILPWTHYMRLMLDINDEPEFEAKEYGSKPRKRYLARDSLFQFTPCSTVTCRDRFHRNTSIAFIIPAIPHQDEIKHSGALDYLDVHRQQFTNSSDPFFIGCRVQHPIYKRIIGQPPSSLYSDTYFYATVQHAKLLQVKMIPDISKESQLHIKTMVTCSAETDGSWIIDMLNFTMTYKHRPSEILVGSIQIYRRHYIQSAIFISAAMLRSEPSRSEYYVQCCAILSCMGETLGKTKKCIHPRDEPMSVTIISECNETNRAEKINFLPLNSTCLYPDDVVRVAPSQCPTPSTAVLTRRGWRANIKMPYRIKWNNPGGKHHIQFEYWRDETRYFASAHMYDVEVPVYGLYHNAGAVTLRLGDVVECLGEGFPVPNMTWILNSYKEYLVFDIIKGRYLKVKSQPFSDSFKLICKARNEVNGVKYELRDSFTFYVKSTKSSWRSWVYLPRVMNAVLYMLFLVVGFIFTRLVTR